MIAIYCCSKDGYTPIMMAAMFPEHHFEIIQALVRAGADLSIRVMVRRKLSSSLLFSNRTNIISWKSHIYVYIYLHHILRMDSFTLIFNFFVLTGGDNCIAQRKNGNSYGTCGGKRTWLPYHSVSTSSSVDKVVVLQPNVAYKPQPSPTTLTPFPT